MKKSELEVLKNQAENARTEFNKLEAAIREIEKAREETWPNVGDDYYSYEEHRNACYLDKWGDTEAQRYLKSQGLIFRTREEAEDTFDRMKVYRQLWALADGGDYVITYSRKNGINASAMNCFYGVPKFSTHEKARKAIAEIGEENLMLIFK